MMTTDYDRSLLPPDAIITICPHPGLDCSDCDDRETFGGCEVYDNMCRAMEAERQQEAEIG
jgi:hypothetical protein